MNWQDERYEDMYFALHGHLNGSYDPECSLCGVDDD